MAVFRGRAGIVLSSVLVSLLLLAPMNAIAATPVKITDQQREDCFLDSTPVLDSVFRSIIHQPGGKSVKLNYDIFPVSPQCRKIIKTRTFVFGLQAPDKTGKMKSYPGLIRFSGLKGKYNATKAVRLSKPLPGDKNSATISIKMNVILRGKDGVVKRDCSQMLHFANGSQDFVSAC